MKKSIFIPFAFLGLILASCNNNNVTTKLDEKNYDLVTPKCVVEDIKTNLKEDKSIYAKYTLTKTDLLNDIESPAYENGFVKFGKDGKYHIASFFKNDIIFSSDEDITIGYEKSDFINTWGLSIISFNTIINGNEKYFIYDSYGNKIFESDEQINNLSDFIYVNHYDNVLEFLLEYTVNYDYQNLYLRYTYNNNQVTLKTEKEPIQNFDDIKYNQDITVGEISRYGYYSLSEYGEDGYYVDNNGYFAYYDKDYKYKLNFKIVFNDYKVIGKYVVSYDTEVVDNGHRDEFDYYDNTDSGKYVQNYIVYDITTGKSVNKKLDNIVINSIDANTIGYVKEEDLYYFNANIIDNGIKSSLALITIDDDFEIQAVELMNNKINEYKLSSDNIIYINDNSALKLYLYDDNLTLTTTVKYTEEMDNYYIATVSGKSGIVDKTGKIIIPIEYNTIYVKNDNGVYYKDVVLGYKNGYFYSINLQTKQSTLLEGYVRSINSEIDYIKKEIVDQDNNVTHKLQLYYNGALIDELDSNGSNPIIQTVGSTDQVILVQYVNAESVASYKTYYKNYSFSCN